MTSEHLDIAARPTDGQAPAGRTSQGCGGGGGGGGHRCGCQSGADTEIVLDVRTIPRPVRHAAVRGAFSVIPAGGSLVLVAPHQPVGMLNELAADAGGAVQLELLKDEPGECHVRVTRTAPTA